MIDEIDLTEEETIDIELDNEILVLGDMLKKIYDTNNNGIVDNAEKVNNHTVESNVPENAKFTDTIYDDTEVKQDISDLQTNKANTSDLSTVATTGSYNDLSNKPTIPTVPTNVSAFNNDAGYITKNVNDMTYYTLKTSTGSLIDLEVNSSTYVVTLRLKDIDGNVISTDTIDLPLESVVVSGSFDSTNKKIVLTLQNGNTVDIPVGDLIAGLQTEITTQNKLASDLVDDSNSGNKFVTTSDITNWNNKIDSSALTDYVKNTDYASDSKGGVIKTLDDYGTRTYNGVLGVPPKTYAQYQTYPNQMLIGKGTLENVITGKQLVNQTYVDNLVGDINTALDQINGEII